MFHPFNPHESCFHTCAGHTYVEYVVNGETTIDYSCDARQAARHKCTLVHGDVKRQCGDNKHQRHNGEPSGPMRLTPEADTEQHQAQHAARYERAERRAGCHDQQRSDERRAKVTGRRDDPPHTWAAEATKKRKKKKK